MTTVELLAARTGSHAGCTRSASAGASASGSSRRTASTTTPRSSAARCSASRSSPSTPGSARPSSPTSSTDAALAAVLTSDVLGDEVDFVGLAPACRARSRARRASGTRSDARGELARGIRRPGGARPARRDRRRRDDRRGGRPRPRPGRRDHDVHVGDDRPAEGLPADARGDRPHEPGDRSPGSPSPATTCGGTRCRCSTSARSSRSRRPCSSARRFATMVDFEAGAALAQVERRARHLPLRHVPHDHAGARRPSRVRLDRHVDASGS